MFKQKQIPFEQLTEVAKQILSANPRAILSGSVALRLQDVSIMRDPKDLDIYIPFDITFKPIPGMIIDQNSDNERYPADGWERDEYSINGIKVDVFYPSHNYKPEFQTEFINKNGFRMIPKEDIIKFKVSHSFGDHWTRYKHRNDIIHMMIAN